MRKAGKQERNLLDRMNRTTAAEPASPERDDASYRASGSAGNLQVPCKLSQL